MPTTKQTEWRMVKFGTLLESSIKVGVKKGEIYDSLPMELVESSKKFPEKYESKTFSGSGSRFANGDTVFARITPCLQNGKIAQVKNLKNVIAYI